MNNASSPFGLPLEAGPLQGINLGDPLNVTGIGGSLSAYSVNPPNPQPLFDSYVVYVHDELGILKIHVSGKKHKNDKYGQAVRSDFDRVVKSLDGKYGANLILRKSSSIWNIWNIWNRDSDFWRALKNGERLLFKHYSLEGHDPLSKISVEAKALSPYESYLTVAYQATSFEGAINECPRKANAAHRRTQKPEEDKQKIRKYDPARADIPPLGKKSQISAPHPKPSSEVSSRSKIRPPETTDLPHIIDRCPQCGLDKDAKQSYCRKCNEKANATHRPVRTDTSPPSKVAISHTPAPFGLPLEAGPLQGIDLGDPSKVISENLSEYIFRNPPNPHPLFSRHSVLVHDELGILRITGSGKINDGQSIRKDFDRFIKALDGQYGTNGPVYVSPFIGHDLVKDYDLEGYNPLSKISVTIIALPPSKGLLTVKYEATSFERTRVGFKTPIGIRVEFLSGSRLFFDHRKEYMRWLSIPVKSPKPNGPKSSLCCLPHPVRRKGAVDAFLTARYSKGFYGSYAVALAGGICPADTLLPAPVGGGCKNGKRRKYG